MKQCLKRPATLENKFFFSCLFLFIFSSHLFAASFEENLIDIKNQIIKKTLELNSFASTPDVSVKILNEGSLKKYMDSAQSVQILFTNTDSILGGLVTPAVFLNQSKEVIGKASLICQVKLSRHYVRAKKFLSKGSKISLDDVELVYEDTHGKSVKNIHSLDEIANKTTTLGIAKGAFLTENSLKDMPVIRRGNPVTIWYLDKNIELKLKGKAVSDGYLKQPITVQPHLNENKFLEGEIIDSQNVRVNSLR